MCFVKVQIFLLHGKERSGGPVGGVNLLKTYLCLRLTLLYVQVKNLFIRTQIENHLDPKNLYLVRNSRCSSVHPQIKTVSILFGQGSVSFTQNLCWGSICTTSSMFTETPGPVFVRNPSDHDSTTIIFSGVINTNICYVDGHERSTEGVVLL